MFRCSDRAAFKVVRELSRRFALRDRTASEHEALDARIGALTDIDAYRRYLAGVAAFRLSADASLRSIDWPDWVGEWRPPVLTQHLADDLAALKMLRPEEAAWCVPEGGLPGVLYVLIGSHLGSQILVQQAARLGLREGNGASHLVAMSNDIASWKHFLALIDAMDGFDPDLAAEGARFTFHKAISAFERP
jgi:heme oxygenase